MAMHSCSPYLRPTGAPPHSFVTGFLVLAVSLGGLTGAHKQLAAVTQADCEGSKAPMKLTSSAAQQESRGSDPCASESIERSKTSANVTSSTFPSACKTESMLLLQEECIVDASGLESVNRSLPACFRL